STRLNSSHVEISYAVFCLKKNKTCARSEEHTSELQSRRDLVCRLLLEQQKACSSTPSRSGHRWRCCSPTGPRRPIPRRRRVTRLFFLRTPRPPRSTFFPSRRSSD